MHSHPFYGWGLHRGDSKGQDGSFKSLLLDWSMKTREKSDTGIPYGIVSAGSGQAEVSRDGQEVVEMRWTWILTYIRLWTQRSRNVLLRGAEKLKWPQLEVNTQERFSRLCPSKLRKIWMGFQDIYRFSSAKYVFFWEFREKRSNLDRRLTKFEGKNAFGQLQGTSLDLADAKKSKRIELLQPTR
jgi:hypothetical protein